MARRRPGGAKQVLTAWLVDNQIVSSVINEDEKYDGIAEFPGESVPVSTLHAAYDLALMMLLGDFDNEEEVAVVWSSSGARTPYPVCVLATTDKAFKKGLKRARAGWEKGTYIFD